MIVTVTPNPAIDLTWSVPRIELGESHRVETGRARAGGKGLNVARVLHAQGHAVHAVATAGGATGSEFAADLRAIDLPHRLVGVAAPTRRSIALHDEQRDQTSIFNELGVNHRPSEWRALTVAATRALPDCRCLVGSGSLPPGGPPTFLADLVSAARAAGVPSVVDTSGPALLEAARARATVLKPNRDELRDATGESDPVAGARALIVLGAEWVVVSLGAEGMLVVCAGDPVTVLHARLPEPLAGNATGAGDAAVAATAAALADGETDPERVLRAATAWSAAAVLMPLAGEISPTHPQLAERLIVEAVR
ncbi:MAG: 1-phosphofructokinase family hexose kinase [Pseudolysinimonas sp.]